MMTVVCVAAILYIGSTGDLPRPRIVSLLSGLLRLCCIIGLYHINQG